MKEFALQPFGDARPGAEHRLTAIVDRGRQDLRLAYALAGDLAGLHIPAPAAGPGRGHRLWENTCFECFFGVEGEQRYWEVNLSPSGEWNVYAFSDYRQGMREEESVGQVGVQGYGQARQYLLKAVVPLPAGLAMDASLELGLSAVLRRADGRCDYRALVHPASRPDFHHRGGFVVILPPAATVLSAGARGEDRF